MILKEIQKCFDEIYLEGKKNMSIGVFFIMTNKRIGYQMDEAKIEGLLYTILLE